MEPDAPPERDGKHAHAGEQVDLHEAAKLLLVSRPVLELLLNRGRLGPLFTGSDGSPLVLKAAVVDYKTRRKARRLEALLNLAELSETMGLYDTESEELRLRKDSDGDFSD